MTEFNIPSEGELLAESLDRLFKSGKANEILNNTSREITATPQPSPGEISSLNDAQKEQIGPCFEGFVNNLYKHGIILLEDRKAAAKQIRLEFNIWKKDMSNVCRQNKLNEEAGIIGLLHLKDVANFAKKKFEEFSRKAVVPDGQIDPKLARQFSDFWSRAEEYISPASDPD